MEKLNKNELIFIFTFLMSISNNHIYCQKKFGDRNGNGKFYFLT